MITDGIPSCIRTVLHSNSFAAGCASLQEASYRLGQSDAFEAVKKKHPAIAADTSLSYPAEGLKELMLQRFNAMVDQDFELLQFLAGEGVDADALRKKLEELKLE